MTSGLMRKYLDILAEQSAPPSEWKPAEFYQNKPPSLPTGAPQQDQRVKDIETVRYGGTPSGGWEQAVTTKSDTDMQALRTAGKYAPDTSLASKVAVTQQLANKGKIDPKDLAASNRDTSVAWKKPVTQTDTKTTTTAPAATGALVEPYAAPVDFNKQAGTMPVVDTSIGKLSGGISLSGSAGDYMRDPALRAELANQSGGKFVADVGQSGQQFAYQQQLSDKARAQLAYRQTPGGGSSIGVGGSYDITPNLQATGGVSKTLQGQGGDRVDVGLRYNFPESTKNIKRK